VLWLDCQRFVKLNHLAPTGGQIDPNDQLIARYGRMVTDASVCSALPFHAPGRYADKSSRFGEHIRLSHIWLTR
jgi:hypothetical protein